MLHDPGDRGSIIIIIMIITTITITSSSSNVHVFPRVPSAWKGHFYVNVHCC